MLTACSQSSKDAQADQLTVFAAASTTDVMQKAAELFESQTGTRVHFSFDSSSNLAKQIKAGSPADIFISADEKWMDDVASANAIKSASRQDLLANELVMIAPAGKPFTCQFTSDFKFVENLPNVKKIAVGDPDHVPAGVYAKQSLQKLRWWDSMQPLLVPAKDVRAALRLVEIGEADAGIVYATDAKSSAKVTVIAAIPSDLHDPVHYPVAQCTDNVHAAEFIDFLRSPEMVKVFESAGFRVLLPIESP
ncbi:MAG TPA: molybdate ABC transporter substrate-binding protein [Phycisphaerales bacterium]|nr:molybdate ABC transporter substrate-binding protein [Phycisphaerales bacterium]